MNGIPTKIPYFTFKNRRYFIVVTLFATSGDIQLTKSTLTFTSEQYHVKLNLPADILDVADVQSVIALDAEKECIYVYLRKRIHHCNSELRNIDIISKYIGWNGMEYLEPPDFAIRRRSRRCANPSHSDMEDDDDYYSDEGEMLAVVDDVADQMGGMQVNDQGVSPPVIGMYGFASRYSDKLNSFEGNWQKYVELKDPDTSDFSSRNIMKFEKEKSDFDIDHYLADYFLHSTDDQSGVIPDIILYKPYWYSIQNPDEFIISTQGLSTLAHLDFHRFNLTSKERMEVLNSALNILLAFTYDFRINFGERTSQSAWNIVKLSSVLSWFHVPECAEDSVTSFMRRVLTYPLYRNWTVGIMALEDVIKIFRLGRRQVLNCFITIYEILDSDEDARIFNQLYITDYLLWFQQVHPQTLKYYIPIIEASKCIPKSATFATLPEIEAQATIVLRDESPLRYEQWRKSLKNCMDDILSPSDGVKLDEELLTDSSVSDLTDEEMMNAIQANQ